MRINQIANVTVQIIWSPLLILHSQTGYSDGHCTNCLSWFKFLVVLLIPSMKIPVPF